MDQIRQRTKRKVPLQTEELIEELNPLLRGGASITNEPMSDCSSTDSIAGLCIVSGRTASNVGATPAGNGCPRRCSTVSSSLSI